MKKRSMLILPAVLLLTLILGIPVLAGAFDDYYDYQNADGTYSYYFTEGVTVTMNEEWYQKTLVKTENGGATFYHKASYEAWEKNGYEGGKLFSIGASVNSDFQELPSFDYIGFNEEDAMNYYVTYPTDLQAYMDDEAIRKEYEALYAGVKDVTAGIRLENGAEETEQAQDWDISVPVELTEEQKDLFEQAYAKQLGVNCEPVILLGTQEKDGTVYCFLAKMTAVYPDAKPYYVLTYIQKGTDGNVSVAETRDLTLDMQSAR